VVHSVAGVGKVHAHIDHDRFLAGQKLTSLVGIEHCGVKREIFLIPRPHYNVVCINKRVPNSHRIADGKEGLLHKYLPIEKADGARVENESGSGFNPTTEMNAASSYGQPNVRRLGIQQSLLGYVPLAVGNDRLDYRCEEEGGCKSGDRLFRACAGWLALIFAAIAIFGTVFSGLGRRSLTATIVINFLVVAASVPIVALAFSAIGHV